MQGSYYETDRVFGLLVLLVFGAILYLIFNWDKIRADSNRRVRAKRKVHKRRVR